MSRSTSSKPMPQPSPLPSPLPENPSVFTRLKVGLRALKVLQVEPTDPLHGALFYDSVEWGLCTAMAREFAQHEEGRGLLSEKPSLSVSNLDLDAMEALPAGTLGHTFARYFREQGLTPIDTLSPPRNDAQYIATRLRETHDFHHLVTGYATDVLGEMELQAFTLGNLHLRTSLLILLQSAKAARMVPGFDATTYARRLWSAFRRGCQSRRLASFRWESHWTTPLATLREQLIAPARH
ncbi:Coq4 family protein [Archangium primigenium]|uniref:Coq4 family protein n=1 Tax=[Archangium] primigenium TaxID=2792470 RepID=UPI001959D984|nr:Coq4 family protein [Archangium primigenium]